MTSQENTEHIGIEVDVEDSALNRLTNSFRENAGQATTATRAVGRYGRTAGSTTLRLATMATTTAATIKGIALAGNSLAVGAAGPIDNLYKMATALDINTTAWATWREVFKASGDDAGALDGILQRLAKFQGGQLSAADNGAMRSAMNKWGVALKDGPLEQLKEISRVLSEVRKTNPQLAATIADDLGVGGGFMTLSQASKDIEAVYNTYKDLVDISDERGILAAQVSDAEQLFIATMRNFRAEFLDAFGEGYISTVSQLNNWLSSTNEDGVSKATQLAETLSVIAKSFDQVFGKVGSIFHSLGSLSDSFASILGAEDGVGLIEMVFTKALEGWNAIFSVVDTLLKKIDAFVKKFIGDKSDYEVNKVGDETQREYEFRKRETNYSRKDGETFEEWDSRRKALDSGTHLEAAEAERLRKIQEMKDAMNRSYWGGGASQISNDKYEITVNVESTDGVIAENAGAQLEQQMKAQRSNKSTTY